jgi:hypothetical protein
VVVGCCGRRLKSRASKKISMKLGKNRKKNSKKK